MWDVREEKSDDRPDYFVEGAKISFEKRALVIRGKIDAEASGNGEGSWDTLIAVPYSQITTMYQSDLHLTICCESDSDMCFPMTNEKAREYIGLYVTKLGEIG